MLHSVKALRGSPVSARDEKFGFVVDVYFDDRLWVLRYVVLDTGRPMPQRSVLVEPACISGFDPSGGLRLGLMRKQVEKKADWLSELPVYLQHDMSATGLPGDDHLRSVEFVTGCSVQARDGGLGHVADLLLDDRDWGFPYLVLDTGHWLPGSKVRVPSARVQSIGWAERTVRLGVQREAILTEA